MKRRGSETGLEVSLKYPASRPMGEKVGNKESVLWARKSGRKKIGGVGLH